MTKIKPTSNRKFKGIVTSVAMAKTIVARVDSFKMHPKYKKRYKVNRKYKIHNTKQQFKVGDAVVFEECRPLSKDKRWRVI